MLRWRPAMWAATRVGVVVDADAASACHRDAAVGDRHEVAARRRCRRSRLAGEPAPVGVLAVPRALDQLALGDLARRRGRLGVGGRTGDLEPHDLGGALGVAGHLRPRASRTPRRWPRRARRRSTGPGGAAGEEDDGVVGRRAAVGGRATLNDSSTPAASSRLSVPGSTSASVVSTASIVAMFGASIAAPLAMPPTVAAPARGHGLLAGGVGGADGLGRRGARLGPVGAGREQRGHRRLDERRSGSGMPMSPVEHTSTFSADAAEVGWPRPRHMRSACSRPTAPLAALALPLLRTTAAAWPPVAARCACEVTHRRRGHLVGREHGGSRHRLARRRWPPARGRGRPRP